MQKLMPETERQLTRFKGTAREQVADRITTEEPLEIKLEYGPIGRRQQASIAVTMRTPGRDIDLALGFLYTEGLIGSRREVLSVQYAGAQLAEEAQENVALVRLHPEVQIDLGQLSRHFYTSSSCGICGKASLDMVRTNVVHLLRPGQPQLAIQMAYTLPEVLLEAQASFSRTGGLHAVGLFDTRGELQSLREDVGRHNAMDKLIGAALQEGKVPLKESILLVSGRASFELVQKALMAGCGFMAAVGAPSSLAIDLAESYGMTLIGFLKEDSCNVYSSPERIV